MVRKSLRYHFIYCILLKIFRRFASKRCKKTFSNIMEILRLVSKLHSKLLEKVFGFGSMFCWLQMRSVMQWSIIFTAFPSWPPRKLKKQNSTSGLACMYYKISIDPTVVRCWCWSVGIRREKGGLPSTFCLNRFNGCNRTRASLQLLKRFWKLEPILTN